MLAGGMNEIKLGDPLDEATEVGPISNARQFAHVGNMVSRAKSDGANVLCRDTTPDTGYFIPPTVLNGLANKIGRAHV